MDWSFITPQQWALAGLVLLAWTTLRMMIQRSRNVAEKEQQREAIIQAAKKAERKRQLDSAVPKSTMSSSNIRTAATDSSPSHASNIKNVSAKWEAEVHKIGQQIVGQIDCKMAALRTITLDANRTANRLEMLTEHLEQIAKKQIEWQQQQLAENTQTESAAGLPTVISTAELTHEAAPLTDILEELTEDLKGIRATIRLSPTFSEQPEPVTVLRLPEPQKETPVSEEPVNIRNEVEMLLNYGLEPQEIARRLNISPGEVDLILQVQQNRFDRTM